jgi:hypothetical protein
MIRSPMLLTVLSLALTMACDNASDDKRKASGAQLEADDKIAAARREADDKIKSAQLEADKATAEARASFMKLREDYRHATTTNLVNLDHKVDDLQAKATLLTGKERVERDASLKLIRSSRESFGRDYQALENASVSTWDGTKSRLDKEWTELKALVDKA